MAQDEIFRNYLLIHWINNSILFNSLFVTIASFVTNEMLNKNNILKIMQYDTVENKK